MIFLRRLCAITLVMLCACVSASAQHMHFAAGVDDLNHNNLPDAGEPLKFVGAAPDGPYHLLPKPAGQRYGGYFSLDEQPRAQFPNDSFTLIALSDGQFGLADLDHAATGAWIWIEITSVTGPAGAHFGFWDENWSFSHTTPTQSFLTNTPTGGFKFVLSEGIDAPGEDPLGHIHNRGWTADQPGSYLVGLTLHDMGTQGPGGGPIHAPSQTYFVEFLAVPEPGGLALVAVGIAVLALGMRRARW
jgi:hypothetical protein